MKLRHIEVNEILQLVTNNAGIQTQVSSTYSLNPRHKWLCIHIYSTFFRLRFVTATKSRRLISLLYCNIRYNYNELNIVMLSLNFILFKKFRFKWAFLAVAKIGIYNKVICMVTKQYMQIARCKEIFNKFCGTSNYLST